MLLIINWECVEWHNILMTCCVLWLAVILNAFVRTPHHVVMMTVRVTNAENWFWKPFTTLDFLIYCHGVHHKVTIYIYIIIIYQYDLRAIYHIRLLLRSWDVVGLYLYILWFHIYRRRDSKYKYIIYLINGCFFFY